MSARARPCITAPDWLGLLLPVDVDDDVDPLSHFGGLERGPDVGLLDLEREVDVGVVAVDLELARAFADPDPRHGGLAPACAPGVDFLLASLLP